MNQQSSIDLTPRASTPPAGSRRGRSWRNVALLTVVLVAASVLVFKFLTNATEYYCNVDELNVKAGCSGASRLRLQGTVVPGTVVNREGETDFTLSFNGKSVQVQNTGAPGALFREGIAVLVEGKLAAPDRFASDLIIVKHSEKYEKEHPDRVTTTSTPA